MNTKAIIPVAGAGARLRPLTYTQPKPLIPVAGKPIMAYIIDQLAEAGITDFVFIIGYLGEKIKDYVEAQYPALNKTFVVQEERLGSAHAIYTAREAFADADEVFIFFGDAIIDVDIRMILDHPQSCLGVKKVKDPRSFGVVEFDLEGRISGLMEKPRIPRSDLAMVGIYKIKEVALLVECLEDTIIQDMRTGEFPLTDTLMCMLEKGAVFQTITVDSWFDCAQKEVLLEANAILLDKKGYAAEDLPTFYNSIMIHPVKIGERCDISNAIIGPHATIGDNVVIHNAIIKDSIIGNFATIKEVILRKSVVGNDTSITGLRQSLNIGDNTEIDFSQGE